MRAGPISAPTVEAGAFDSRTFNPWLEALTRLDDRALFELPPMRLNNRPSHEDLWRRLACILTVARTMTTTLELVFATVAITLVISAVAAPLSPTATGPPVGVSADPCARVPIGPTPAHEAAANPYASWMSEWLALDWGQQCRYRRENAALSPPSRSRVVFLGDSITEGWKSLDPDFFVPDILDRGISGQTTAQMLVRFRADVLDLRPQVVHIMAGTNDIAGNTGATSLAIIQGNMMSMVEQARCHGITVILASIPSAAQFAWRQDIQPAATIAAMNAWLRSYAEREHIVFVDYYSALSDGRGGLKSSLSDDGVHPNAAGYAVMRPLARAALEQVLSAGPHGSSH
jgi:lysophospholipase L1-like esterase